MRLNSIEITPIQVTITNEEILADLAYPAPAEAGPVDAAWVGR